MNLLKEYVKSWAGRKYETDKDKTKSDVAPRHKTGLVSAGAASAASASSSVIPKKHRHRGGTHWRVRRTRVEARAFRGERPGAGGALERHRAVVYRVTGLRTLWGSKGAAAARLTSRSRRRGHLRSLAKRTHATPKPPLLPPTPPPPTSSCHLHRGLLRINRRS